MDGVEKAVEKREPKMDSELGRGHRVVRYSRGEEEEC